MNKTLKTNNKLNSFPYPPVPRSPVLSERTCTNPSENSRALPYNPHSSNLTVLNTNSYSLNSSAKQTLKPSQINTFYTLSSPTHNPNLPSFCNYQLNSIANRRETPSRRHVEKKHSKKPALQLNLGEIDMGIEEFPEGAQATVYQKKLGINNTPLESPTIKTLRGIHEGIGSVIPSFSSMKSITTRTKKIAFPSGAFDNQENYNKGFFREYGSPKVSAQNRGVTRRTPLSRCKDVFLNMDALKTVTSFLSCRDIVCFKGALYEFRNESKYRKHFKDRLFELLRHGLKDEEQYKFWDALVDFKIIRDLHPSAFTAQVVKDCSYMKDIMKDLDRTLPEYEKYSTVEGKEDLLKVLVALANTIQDIGYIQGLNSIAGVFLFYLNEEKSYWITLYMMEKLKMKNILREDFNSVHVLNYQLKAFLDNYNPTVAEFLKQGGVDISNYTTCWFITFYSYFLTLPNTVKAWNFLFINGNSFLVQLGLAVFSRYKDKILNMDVDDLGAFFKYDLREISANDDLLFEEAIQFHVSDRLMKDLEGYYKKGKPQLKLIKDFYNKLQWKPVEADPSVVKSPSKKPNFQLDLGSCKKENNGSISRLSQGSDSRRLGSPSSALEKGKDFVQNIVHTITIDLPEALKGIFVKSPTTSDTQRALSKQELNESSQPSTQISLQAGSIGSKALQTLDENYNLRPAKQVDVVLKSMDLLLNKENRRTKCRTEKKIKKETLNKGVNLTIPTVETEENESSIMHQPPTVDRVRPSKEVSLVEMKNQLMNRKRQNLGVNNDFKPRPTVDDLRSPKAAAKSEEGFFSPRFKNRLNH